MNEIMENVLVRAYEETLDETVVELREVRELTDINEIRKRIDKIIDDIKKEDD
ncbi:MAG: hypothetical protein ACXAEN_18505 [Candidatus Thorarchaeota archaeon]|jgi:hypothetical protein